jgi:queuine tRNA-ribosyltransferase
MCLDVCAPGDAPREELERAVAITSRWAERQARVAPVSGQLRFGISQGGADSELRRRSLEEVTALPFDGYALGGLAVGEAREQTFDTVEWAAPLMPADRPRYFMGIGDPVGILEVIARGIDLFDCVLPTRMARTGSALTWSGRINLRNARYARDDGPLEDGCGCPACDRFSRGYVRHLVTQQEILGGRLLSLHNLWFVLDLTARARTAIERGVFSTFREDALARLTRAPEEDQWVAPAF